MSEETPTELAEIFAEGRLKHYEKGEVIAEPGRDYYGPFLVKNGYVKIYTITYEGDVNLVQVVGPGDVFLLSWALDQLPTKTYFEAMCEGQAWLLPLDEFQRQIRKNLNFSFAVLMQMVAINQNYVDRIENLEFRRANQRVAYRLLFLARRFGVRTAGGIEIAVPLTHQDMADATNMTRETANRVLSTFTRQKIISLKNHTMTIHKKTALEEVIDEEPSA